jgi:hypothetical protein
VRDRHAVPLVAQAHGANLVGASALLAAALQFLQPR